MRGDTRKLVSWAFRENILTHEENELYRQYLRLSLEENSHRARSRFGDILKRLGSAGIAVRILDSCWTFPEADVFVRLREYPECPDIIIQDALKKKGIQCHAGGFDVLFQEACITVPPRRKVMFTDNRDFFEITADLRRFSGIVIRLNAFAVPSPDVHDTEQNDMQDTDISNGIRTMTVGGFDYACSTVLRAEAEAWWLVRSEWGKKTGLAGQQILLEQLKQERLDDEAGISR